MVDKIHIELTIRSGWKKLRKSQKIWFDANRALTKNTRSTLIKLYSPWI